MPSTPGYEGRINFAFAGELPPWMVAQIAKTEAEQAENMARRRARRDVPEHRKPPAGEERVLGRLDELAFPPGPQCGVEFALRDVRVCDSGLAFTLTARGDGAAQGMLGDRWNLSHRIKNRSVGRVYLGVILPDGTVVSNKRSHLHDAPEDEDRTTAWLYGGSSRSSSTETSASYFLSPSLPVSSVVKVTIAYPEAGLDIPLSVDVDYSMIVL
ncbi:hypothetical protein [Tomitella fengzijianii]|uniref:hypothetical protein n=1 Tax=Tomitella fengzijianii TaxID=2597660 RepID=UPI00131A8DEF|nr:hypothetical protein [Tomitella fengzijianii]